MDIIQGRGPAPSFVIQLVLRLPDDSLTAALASGGREHFGWGADRHLLADIYDATNLTTRAAGNWAKQPPEIPAWPRPKREAAEDGKANRPSGKPVSVKDIFAQFNGSR